MRTLFLSWLLFLAVTGLVQAPAELEGERTEVGEFRQWHRITLRFEGPESAEDATPNPFTDYRLNVASEHSATGTRQVVPGYYAADGRAAETSAASGNVWLVEFRPDHLGTWRTQASFRAGPGVAVQLEAEAGAPAAFDGATGSFAVAPSDKTGRDFRAQGRLVSVGEHYLRFMESGRPFLKAGPDSPETLLAYADFDGTVARKKGVPLLTWQPHERDWRPGDPSWQGERGKGLIGALNYLASKGCTSFSFLTYNAGGDGDNVWPFVERDQKLRYDCSKLAQWNLVLDHATKLGLFCHFKTQETENDDERVRRGDEHGTKPEALDGGRLGLERKLYYRELVARFGHLLALNWNLGEENTQSVPEVVEEAAYLRALDPYDHLQVIHTYPYASLMGTRSVVGGASLQNRWNLAHQEVLRWLAKAHAEGRPWVVCNDEQNPADLGVPPDAGYQGFDGVAHDESGAYTADDIRKQTLWGTLTAGGMGVEYYFGYQLPQNDLGCQDWRSRDGSWSSCGVALGFFQQHEIPVNEMAGADELLTVEPDGPANYCLAQPGTCYVVYLGEGGAATLDLGTASGRFRVQWFDPRHGGPLLDGSLREVPGGGRVALGRTPDGAPVDWVALLRRVEPEPAAEQAR